MKIEAESFFYEQDSQFLYQNAAAENALKHFRKIAKHKMSLI